MSDEPPETEGVLIWENKTQNNDHSLVWRNRMLILTIIKPDKTIFVCEPVSTISSADEWKTAFVGLGPKWNQDSESNVDDRYQAVRRAQTPQEEAVWTVDHTKLVAENVGDAQYKIADKLAVVLRGQS